MNISGKKLISYPNGKRLWDGKKVYYKNGKIAWDSVMAFFPNGQIAFVGHKCFHYNGTIFWDGHKAFDEDGNSLPFKSIALILDSSLALLCDNHSIEIDIMRGEHRFILKMF